MTAAKGKPAVDGACVTAPVTKETLAADGAGTTAAAAKGKPGAGATAVGADVKIGTGDAGANASVAKGKRGANDAGGVAKRRLRQKKSLQPMMLAPQTAVAGGTVGANGSAASVEREKPATARAGAIAAVTEGKCGADISADTAAVAKGKPAADDADAIAADAKGKLGAGDDGAKASVANGRHKANGAGATTVAEGKPGADGVCATAALTEGKQGKHGKHGADDIDATPVEAAGKPGADDAGATAVAEGKPGADDAAAAKAKLGSHSVSAPTIVAKVMPGKQTTKQARKQARKQAKKQAKKQAQEQAKKQAKKPGAHDSGAPAAMAKEMPGTRKKQAKLCIAKECRRITFPTWWQTMKERYPDAPPRKCAMLCKCPENRQQHEDAALMDIVRLRAVKSVLTDAELAILKTASWGEQELQSWLAEAAAAPDTVILDDEPSEAEEDDVFGADRERREKVKSKRKEEQERVWACVHTIRRIGDQWKSNRPGQRWVAVRDRNCSPEIRAEHGYALALKTLNAFYVSGSMHGDVHDALMRLPETWCFDMLLCWQAQLMNKMRKLADTYPDEVPKQALGSKTITDVLDPAKWVREFQCRVTVSPAGLSPHVAEEFKTWVSWGGSLLDSWQEMRRKREERLREAVPKHYTLFHERLLAVLRTYQNAAPERRLYVSSDAERQEQNDANFLVCTERNHFRGGVKLETLLTAADSSGANWFRELVTGCWEKNKTEGIDTEEIRMVERLRDIGRRFPQSPPNQVSGLERERWAMSSDLRIRHADAWWLRCLKDTFFEKGLSQKVSDAMCAIPVWGRPRLEEWRIQKDQRAAQIFERNNRKSPKQEDSGTPQHDAGARGSGDCRAEVPCTAQDLRDGDRLCPTGKEPRVHRSRLRVSSCHGKTVAEALRSVRDGVLRLSRKRIAQDIAQGYLKVEASEAEPRTPSRAATAVRPQRCSSGQKRPREETFRGFTGKVVKALASASKPKIRDDCSGAVPLGSLVLGDVEELTPEQIAHYERQLGWSSRRKNSERIDSLSQNLQTNGIAGEAAPTAEFRKLSEYERTQLREDELRHFEQMGLLGERHELTIQERRDRLKDHIRCTEEEQARAAPKKVQIFMQQWKSGATGAPGTWKRGEVFSLDEE